MTTLSTSKPSIQSLKQKAKILAKKEKTTLNQALNLIANDHGFTHWALLMRHFNKIRLNHPETIWHSMYLGEMMLLAAPEGAGKLSMALNLARIALQENTNVYYITVHDNYDLVHERFSIILDDCSVSRALKIIESDSDEQFIMDQLKSIESNAFVIIDYMQAIKMNKPMPNGENFLSRLKEISKEKSFQLLMLSQVTKEGEIEILNQLSDTKQISRYFSHYLHLSHVDDANGRELALMKSTHYQCHETVLRFSKETYVFSEGSAY